MVFQRDTQTPRDRIVDACIVALGYLLKCSLESHSDAAPVFHIAMPEALTRENGWCLFVCGGVALWLGGAWSGSPLDLSPARVRWPASSLSDPSLHANLHQYPPLLLVYIDPAQLHFMTCGTYAEHMRKEAAEMRLYHAAVGCMCWDLSNQWRAATVSPPHRHLEEQGKMTISLPNRKSWEGSSLLKEIFQENSNGHVQVLPPDKNEINANIQEKKYNKNKMWIISHIFS